MSDKYIIKNCEQIIGDNFCCSKNALCSDCTDCKLKKIVELCKGSIRENERDIYRAGRMSLAINILGLLDIEEVE